MKTLKLFAIVIATFMLAACGEKSVDERAAELAQKGDALSPNEIDESIDIMLKASDEIADSAIVILNACTTKDELTEKAKNVQVDVRKNYPGVTQLGEYLTTHPDKMSPEQKDKFEKGSKEAVNKVMKAAMQGFLNFQAEQTAAQASGSNADNKQKQ